MEQSEKWGKQSAGGRESDGGKDLPESERKRAGTYKRELLREYEEVMKKTRIGDGNVSDRMSKVRSKYIRHQRPYCHLQDTSDKQLAGKVPACLQHFCCCQSSTSFSTPSGHSSRTRQTRLTINVFGGWTGRMPHARLMMCGRAMERKRSRVWDLQVLDLSWSPLPSLPLRFAFLRLTVFAHRRPQPQQRRSRRTLPRAGSVSALTSPVVLLTMSRLIRGVGSPGVLTANCA
eukprot:768650-Hanusia_phi.AAC.1